MKKYLVIVCLMILAVAVYGRGRLPAFESRFLTGAPGEPVAADPVLVLQRRVAKLENEVKTLKTRMVAVQRKLRLAVDDDEAAAPEWGVGSHFGRVTTVWVSKDILENKIMLAQIMHTIRVKYGADNIVWFFDSQKHTPTGVPMTDEQMLHWIGLYNPIQADTLKYIEITNPNSSPPETRTIETGIRPGLSWLDE